MRGSPSVTCAPELSFPFMRELDGALADVMKLRLYGGVGEVQWYGLSGWLSDGLLISREGCRGEVTVPRLE
jgi:hypothetical protein